MSSEKGNPFWKAIGFRLWLWYTGIFITIALLLLLISSTILSSVLTNKDKENVQLKLKQLASVYREGGLDALAAASTGGDDPAGYVFVRVSGPQNKTIYITGLNLFPDYDFQSLETQGVSPEAWIRLSEKGEEDEWLLFEEPEALEIAALRLDPQTVLQTGTTSEKRQDFLATFRWSFAGVITPLFLIAGTVLSFRSLRPLRSMIATVRSIQSGKIESRVPVNHSGDELDQLALLFNEMLEKIQNLIEGMRNSLDNVAHDLRTPITRLRAVAESALESDSDNAKCREALADCLEESDRILSLLNTLMDISEAETGSMKLRLEKVSVPSLIQDSVELYRYIAEDKNIGLTAECGNDLFINADRDRMRQVLANLLDNALKYTRPGGQVKVDAFQRNGDVVISIEDNGSGIPQDDLPRIWDRLYRSDKTRSQKGIGLGLSLVKFVVKAHAGRAEASSEVDKGSVFKLYLPASNASIQ